MARPRRGKWVPCPEGELSDLGARLRARGRRRHFLQAAGGAAAALVTGGLLFAWLRPPSGQGRPAAAENDYAGISCSLVKGHAAAYANKALGDAQRDQVRQHLSQCPSCREHYKARGLM